MLQKLLSFNENAFGFTRNFIIPEKDYAELSVGETRLSFASKKFAESKGFTQSKVSDKPLGFKLGFTTKNVEETLVLVLVLQLLSNLLQNSVGKLWRT